MQKNKTQLTNSCLNMGIYSHKPRFWFRNLKQRIRNIKYMIQRIKYGYSEYDLWDLDYYIVGLLGDSLNALSKNVCSTPWGFTEEEWRAYLQNLSKRFEFMRSEAFDNFDIESQNKYLHETFDMLAEHFFDLWD